MELYRLLPATDFGVATLSIGLVKHLRTSKQGAFSQVILARVECVRLIVFSAIDLGVHIVAAALKFTAAVIQVPCYLMLGGITPRAALIDVHSHMARSGKLATAICGASLLGIVRPDWAVEMYQRLSLVEEPEGQFARVVDSIRSVAKAAWASPHRNQVLAGAAVAVAVLVGGLSTSGSGAIKPSFSPIQPWVIGGVVLGVGALCKGMRHYKNSRGNQAPISPQTPGAGQQPAGVVGELRGQAVEIQQMLNFPSPTSYYRQVFQALDLYRKMFKKCTQEETTRGVQFSIDRIIREAAECVNSAFARACTNSVQSPLNTLFEIIFKGAFLDPSHLPRVKSNYGPYAIAAVERQRCHDVTVVGALPLEVVRVYNTLKAEIPEEEFEKIKMRAQCRMLLERAETHIKNLERLDFGAGIMHSILTNYNATMMRGWKLVPNPMESEYEKMQDRLNNIEYTLGFVVPTGKKEAGKQDLSVIEALRELAQKGPLWSDASAFVNSVKLRSKTGCRSGIQTVAAYQEFCETFPVGIYKVIEEGYRNFVTPQDNLDNRELHRVNKLFQLFRYFVLRSMPADNLIQSLDRLSELQNQSYACLSKSLKQYDEVCCEYGMDDIRERLSKFKLHDLGTFEKAVLAGPKHLEKFHKLQQNLRSLRALARLHPNMPCVVEIMSWTTAVSRMLGRVLSPADTSLKAMNYLQEFVTTNELTDRKWWKQVSEDELKKLRVSLLLIMSHALYSDDPITKDKACELLDTILPIFLLDSDLKSRVESEFFNDLLETYKNDMSINFHILNSEGLDGVLAWKALRESAFSQRNSLTLVDRHHHVVSNWPSYAQHTECSRGMDLYREYTAACGELLKIEKDLWWHSDRIFETTLRLDDAIKGFVEVWKQLIPQHFAILKRLVPLCERLNTDRQLLDGILNSPSAKRMLETDGVVLRELIVLPNQRATRFEMSATALRKAYLEKIEPTVAETITAKESLMRREEQRLDAAMSAFGEAVAYFRKDISALSPEIESTLQRWTALAKAKKFTKEDERQLEEMTHVITTFVALNDQVLRTKWTATQECYMTLRATRNNMQVLTQEKADLYASIKKEPFQALNKVVEDLIQATAQVNNPPRESAVTQIEEQIAPKIEKSALKLEWKQAIAKFNDTTTRFTESCKELLPREQLALLGRWIALADARCPKEKSKKEFAEREGQITVAIGMLNNETLANQWQAIIADHVTIQTMRAGIDQRMEDLGRSVPRERLPVQSNTAAPKVQTVVVPSTGRMDGILPVSQAENDFSGPIIHELLQILNQRQTLSSGIYHEDANSDIYAVFAESIRQKKPKERRSAFRKFISSENISTLGVTLMRLIDDWKPKACPEDRLADLIAAFKKPSSSPTETALRVWDLMVSVNGPQRQFILANLFRHLQAVKINSHGGSMTSERLAKIWAPNLLPLTWASSEDIKQGEQVIQVLIDCAHQIAK